MVEGITKKFDAIEDKFIFRSKLFTTSLHSTIIISSNSSKKLTTLIYEKKLYFQEKSYS